MDKTTFLTNLINKLGSNKIDVNLLSKTIIEKYWVLDNLDYTIISFGYDTYGITILLNYFPCNNNPPVLPTIQCKPENQIELCTECLSFWDWSIPDIATWIDVIPDNVALEAVDKINIPPPISKTSYIPIIAIGTFAALAMMSQKKKKLKKSL